jgi:hypothetical protein
MNHWNEQSYEFNKRVEVSIIDDKHNIICNISGISKITFFINPTSSNACIYMYDEFMHYAKVVHALYKNYLVRVRDDISNNVSEYEVYNEKGETVYGRFRI